MWIGKEVAKSLDLQVIRGQPAFCRERALV